MSTLKLNSASGGTISLKPDAAATGAEVIVIKSTEVQIVSPDSSIWALRIDNLGNITATKL